MNTPLWEIFQNGTKVPVTWTDATNPRFAIYRPPDGTRSGTRDVVFDRETGLVWARNAKLSGSALNWLDANTTLRELKLACKMGWRLPSAAELSSLLDPTQNNPALPVGHPFLNMQLANASYWTSTNWEGGPDIAWFVNFTGAGAGLLGKQQTGFTLPIRGGWGF